MTLKMTFCRQKKRKANNIWTESIITLQTEITCRKMLKTVEIRRKIVCFSETKNLQICKVINQYTEMRT